MVVKTIRNLTKKVIENSFKELLNDFDIHKITISLIIEKAEVSRQTFYYHFKDIYDLQEWIIREGVQEVFEKSIKCKTYKESLGCFFQYIYEEKAFISKALESPGRKFIEKILYINIQEYLYSYRKYMGLKDLWSRKDYAFNIDFYTCAIVGICIKFIEDKNFNMHIEEIVEKTCDLFDAQSNI